MSLFGALLGDMMGDDDPFFGPQMRQMHHMNSMMNSLFADPFGMFGGGSGGGGSMMALEGPRHTRTIMPQMPHFNRLFTHMDGMGMLGRGMPGSSYTSSTVVMSSGPNGRPQVYSETNSTQLGPDGLKETRQTVEDSRTGQRKMAIGHHIGERAHVVERERNVYTGEEEEHQDYINIEEEEADQFNREYQQRAGQYLRGAAPRRAALAPAGPAPLAIEAAPPAHTAPPATRRRECERDGAPSARRPLRHAPSHAPPAPAPAPAPAHSGAAGAGGAASTGGAGGAAGVRSVYGGAHPQHPQRARRHRHHQHHQPQPHHQPHQH